MGRKKQAAPTLRFHRGSGRYYVSYPTWSGIRDFYLGRKTDDYDEIVAKFQKKTAEFLADLPNADRVEGTVGKLALLFLNRAQKIYRKADVDGRETDTGSYARYRHLLSLVLELYEELPLSQFRAAEFIAVRNRLIEVCGRVRRDPETGERTKLPPARSTINHRMGLLRKVFAQSTGLGLEYPDLNLLGLNKVPDLVERESATRETVPVASVSDGDFEKVLAELKRTNPIVADMAAVQWGTGLRSSELCNLRAVDLDTEIEEATGCWEYRLARHKTRRPKKIAPPQKPTLKIYAEPADF